MKKKTIKSNECNIEVKKNQFIKKNIERLKMKSENKESEKWKVKSEKWKVKSKK